VSGSKVPHLLNFAPKCHDSVTSQRKSTYTDLAMLCENTKMFFPAMRSILLLGDVYMDVI